MAVLLLVANSTPVAMVAQIKTGAMVEVRGSSGATRFKALVRAVAASADPVTPTFGMKVALGAQDALTLGSTATVRLQPIQIVTVDGNEVVLAGGL